LISVLLLTLHIYSPSYKSLMVNGITNYYQYGDDLMGFLGGDNEPAQTPGSSLVDQQIMENKAELQAKAHNLYQTRLDIIKGQGGENWTADRSNRAASPPNPAAGFNFGGGGFLNRN
jgi:hypothetical protein